MSRTTARSGRLRTRQGPARPSRPRYVVLVAAGFLICLAYLWGRDETLSQHGRIVALEQSRDALQRTVDRLDLEMIGLRSSDHVVELARQRLDLDFPEQPVQILAVAPEAANRGPSLWTYMENAFVIAVEGVQRHMSSDVHAREVSALPDTTGGA